MKKEFIIFLFIALSLILVSCQTNSSSDANVDTSNSNQNPSTQSSQTGIDTSNNCNNYKASNGEYYFSAQDGQELFGGPWRESIVSDNPKCIYGIFVESSGYQIEAHFDRVEMDPESDDPFAQKPDSIEGDVFRYTAGAMIGNPLSLQKINGIGDRAYFIYNGNGNWDDPSSSSARLGIFKGPKYFTIICTKGSGLDVPPCSLEDFRKIAERVLSKA